MKKSIYNYLKYDIYRYAPESFKLFLKENNKLIQLDIDPNTLKDFGYTAITKGESATESEIKKYFRKHTIISNKETRFNFGIRLQKTNESIYIPGITVKQYDIKDHLYWYKQLKRQLEKNNYRDPIKTTSATLDGKFNIKEIREHDDKLQLSNRVYLKAV